VRWAAGHRRVRLGASGHWSSRRPRKPLRFLGTVASPTPEPCRPHEPKPWQGGRDPFGAFVSASRRQGQHHGRSVPSLPKCWRGRGVKWPAAADEGIAVRSPTDWAVSFWKCNYITYHWVELGCHTRRLSDATCIHSDIYICRGCPLLRQDEDETPPSTSLHRPRRAAGLPKEQRFADARPTASLCQLNDDPPLPGCPRRYAGCRFAFSSTSLPLHHTPRQI
jgi:hypothetical protein